MQPKLQLNKLPSKLGFSSSQKQRQWRHNKKANKLPHSLTMAYRVTEKECKLVYMNHVCPSPTPHPHSFCYKAGRSDHIRSEPFTACFARPPFKFFEPILLFEWAVWNRKTFGKCFWHAIGSSEKSQNFRLRVSSFPDLTLSDFNFNFNFNKFSVEEIKELLYLNSGKPHDLPIPYCKEATTGN